MGFPFPRLIGSVEVEERRPRYWNEPRRKRLNFVKSHNTKSKSDDWQMVPKSHPQGYPRNEQERWDWHQAQAQMRFHGNDIQKANTLKIQEFQQAQAFWERMAGIHGHPPMPPDHHIEDHSHHGSDDDIIEVISSSDDSSDDDDDHHHHHHHHHAKIKKAPKMIELKPKKLPKEFYPPKKSHGKKDKDKDKAKKKDKRSSSKHSTTHVLFGEIDTDYSSDDSFDLARRRLRSHSRGRSRSKPRFVTLDDSDSDRSYVYHLSPKHRGRRK